MRMLRSSATLRFCSVARALISWATAASVSLRLASWAVKGGIADLGVVFDEAFGGGRFGRVAVLDVDERLGVGVGFRDPGLISRLVSGGSLCPAEDRDTSSSKNEKSSKSRGAHRVSKNGVGVRGVYAMAPTGHHQY